MFFDGMRFRAAIFAPLALLAMAASAWGQTAAEVKVIPLARSAAFSFRLDQVAPTRYVKEDFGPLYAPTPVATLEWRVPGDAAWKKAQPFIRVQSDRFAGSGVLPDPRMATMLFGLQEGATYEYRVAFNGEGYPTTPVTGRFTTLTSTPPAATGAVIPITVGPSTTSAQIRTALLTALSNTPESNAGKVIEFRSSLGPGVKTIVRGGPAGTYAAGAWVWSGTAAGWLTVRTAAGHDIVFDGSRAEYDVINGGKWVAYTNEAAGITAAKGVYVSATSIPKPLTVAYERPGEDVGILLYDVNVGETWDGGAEGGGPSTGFGTLLTRANANGAAWMWVADSVGATTGKVYIRLHGATDPNTVRVKLPVLDSLFDLTNCHHVVVDGLHLAYSQAWTGGIGLTSVSDIVIKNCRVVCTGMYVGTRTSGESPKNRVVVKGNRFEMRGLGPDADPSLPVPKWSWAKASKQEKIGIPLKGVSVSILDNQIKGVFNGVSNFAGFAPDGSDNEVNNRYAEATEIDGNFFYGIGDDSIEPEQWCVNQAYTNNTFTACYKGISCAPVIGGPVYIVRNRFLGRGEFAAAGDKQAFTKMGNNDPGDPAFKMVANNTIVNVNANASGIPLVGFANSGASYNGQYYNNYVASDGYPVDFGYGALGYPHIFDGNRYRSKRFSVSLPGYDRGFALGVFAWQQGESTTGSDHRNAATFSDWQMGRSTTAAANWPGYDGTIPTFPRVVATKGTSRYPAQDVTWLHDTHGSFSEGDPELVAPFTGDFRPLAGSVLSAAGIALANITFDCGPAWAACEESGRPTVGAIPQSGASTKPNEPPVAMVDRGVTGVVGKPVNVSVTYNDYDGTVASVTATVAGPDATFLTAQVTKVSEGLSTVTFTPRTTGTHTVSVAVKDDKGAMAQASASVIVSEDAPLVGQLDISISASKTEAKPGEPVVFTIVVTNPTTRAMSNVILKQLLPTQMVLNRQSAMLDGNPVDVSVSDGSMQVALGTVKAGEKHTVTVTAIVN